MEKYSYYITLLEQEHLSQFLAQEMRDASRGSFPLSPGVMDGHYAVANLYWYFRQPLLAKASITGIFGVENPAPPILTLPEGHRAVSLGGLNGMVWEQFLETVFTKRPRVNAKTEIQALITTNANSDANNFDRRLQGEKSHVVPGDRPVPSLLRSFLYENMFPVRSQFFSWLFTEMRREAADAAKQNFAAKWSKSLDLLVGTWNTQFPHNPFIPKTPR